MAKLAFHIQESGNRVKVILPCHGDGEKLLSEFGVNYSIVKMNSWIVPRNPLRLLAYMKCLIGIAQNHFWNIKYVIREIDLFKPSAVYMNGTWGYLGAYVGIKLGIPVVWHIREFLEEDQNRKIFLKKIGYKLMSQSSKIICISEALKKKYVNKIDNKKIVVIYNGIDIDYYLNEDHKLFISSKVKGIIIGGINRSKGQYKAIRKIMKEKRDDFELNIVGGLSGINKLIWPVFSKLFCDSRIHYWGRQYDVRKFISDSDICIVPSRSEAWGRVTVEAMLGGCVVVGSNTGATPEILKDGETGYLFDYKKFDLMSVMNGILGDKDQVRIVAQKGQLNAREKYSSVRNAESVIKILESLSE